MTVNTTNNRVSYAGNGVTTAFSFPNKFFADTDLVVLVVTDATGASVTKTLTTDYTVSGAGAPTGGTVTMVAAPATGTTLVIYRNPPLTQLTDLVDGDPFSVETGVEAPLDRQMLVIQRLYDLISRSLRLADSDTTTASTSLPSPAASNFLGWNATATALQNYVAADLALHPVSTYIATLLDDADAATARATLGALASSAVSSYGLTLVGDADAATARGTLGVAQDPNVSGKVQFPAAQVPSADPNALDDYEEGTWTPSLGGSATYISRSGNYTKIGRAVWFQCSIQVNAIGTGSTSQVSGLPFAPDVNARHYCGVSDFSNLAVTVISLWGNVLNSAGNGLIAMAGLSAASATAATVNVFGNNAVIVMSGYYFV